MFTILNGKTAHDFISCYKETLQIFSLQVFLKTVCLQKITKCLAWKKRVYDYFVLCKMFGIIRKRKPEHFTKEDDKQLIVHNHETRSKVNNKLLLP